MKWYAVTFIAEVRYCGPNDDPTKWKTNSEHKVCFEFRPTEREFLGWVKELKLKSFSIDIEEY